MVGYEAMSATIRADSMCHDVSGVMIGPGSCTALMLAALDVSCSW